jgi:hypothetical protein
MDDVDEWRECLWRRSRNAAPIAAAVVMPPLRNSDEQAELEMRRAVNQDRIYRARTGRSPWPRRRPAY